MQRRKGDHQHGGSGTGSSSSLSSPEHHGSRDDGRRENDAGRSPSRLKDKPAHHRHRRASTSASSGRAAAAALAGLALLGFVMLRSPPTSPSGALPGTGPGALPGMRRIPPRANTVGGGAAGHGKRPVPPARGMGPSGASEEDAGAADTDADGGDSPPQRSKPRRRTSAEATAAMLAQSSTFVDGEKKLKAEMKKLMERQEKGQDIGAEILSRWLGDDIPAVAPFDPKGKEEWRAKVDARILENKEVDRQYWDRLAKKVGVDRREDAPRQRAERAAARGEGPPVKQWPGVVQGEGGRWMPPQGDVDGDGQVEAEQKDGKMRRVVDPDGSSVGDPGSVHDEKEEAAHARVKAGGGKGDMDASATANKVAPNAEAKKSYPSPAEMAVEGEGEGADAAEVLLEPTFGRHRPQRDAVFAFAEGYELKIYLTFMESLRSTGYTGDVVLAVSSPPKLKEGVEDYLRSFTEERRRDTHKEPNVIVYAVDWTCYDNEGGVAADTKEGARKCKINHLYGARDPNSAPDEAPKPVEDPRDPRPVATARYELYWAWSLRYDPSKWIMLIDSRDAYFQGDPFRGLKAAHENENELHLFEENAESATLGESTFNRNWLTTAYGYGSISSFLDKPIVCSGSSLGTQVAVEAYLRAMVAQFDETKCMVKGCDQGFHNYLHYSDGLKGLRGVDEVVVHPQGKGIINNLGLLRSKPLRERGVLVKSDKTGEEAQVVNWDGERSRVVHQFDRDEELNKIVKQRRKVQLSDWRGRAAAAK